MLIVEVYPINQTAHLVHNFYCRQLVTNCRTGKADQALSFWFLMQWLLGDVTNLIGAVLTRQLATQGRERGEGERERGKREEGLRERERVGVDVHTY